MYPGNQSVDFFSDPDHTPVFLDDVVASASEEVLEVCGGDAACIFDFTETGSELVALATQETNANNSMDLAQSRKLRKYLVVASYPLSVTVCL